MTIIQIGMTIVTPKIMLQPTAKQEPEASNLILCITNYSSCNINVGNKLTCSYK